MSGDLTLSNGLRTMNLMKIQRNGMNCQFPNWVLKQWKIIPRGGMRAMPQNSAPRPRQVTFPDLHSFILASQLVGSTQINPNISQKLVIFYNKYLTLSRVHHVDKNSNAPQLSMLQGMKLWLQHLPSHNVTENINVYMQN